MSVADKWSRRGVIGASAALAIAAPAFAASDSTVRAPAGNFTGTSDAGVRAYRGIRYGRAERFRAATAVATPGQTVRAEAFGPVCPQRGRYQPQSEDCLFLNVWTAQPAGARKPVMVYIHGGAYANGSVTDPLNDGQQLAARGASIT